LPADILTNFLTSELLTAATDRASLGTPAFCAEAETLSDICAPICVQNSSWHHASRGL